MNEISSFFSKDLDEDQAISFLIDGRKKDKSFYNYITRKIVSQLEVSRNLYPMGPSILINNTQLPLFDIYEGRDPYILEKINKLDKYNRDYLTYTKEYFDKITAYYKSFFFLPISKEDFDKKIEKYLTEDQKTRIGKHYKNIKKWIEIQQSIQKKDLTNEENEKECYVKSYDEYMNSVSHFKENIKSLKQDIAANYYSYKLAFTHDFKNDSLLEIIDYVRERIIDKMLIGYDNNYRDYDLNNIVKDNQFFNITTKPNDIYNQMDLLNKEYEEVKKIEDINEYIERIIIVTQKFLRIHPYKDGNGRTSRLLLDILLINRNIFPPILYSCNYERYIYDAPSEDYTIRWKKEPIIEYVKNKINNTNLEFNTIIEKNGFRNI